MHNVCYLCKKQIYEINGTYICIDGHINTENMAVVEGYNTQSQKSSTLKVERTNYFEVFKLNKAENFFNLLYFTTFEIISDFLKCRKQEEINEILKKFLNIYLLSYEGQDITNLKNYKAFQLSAYFTIRYFIDIGGRDPNVNTYEEYIFNLEKINTGKFILTLKNFNEIIFSPKIFMQKLKKICFKLFNADFIDKLRFSNSITVLSINDFIKLEGLSIFIFKYVDNSSSIIYLHLLEFTEKHNITDWKILLQYILPLNKIFSLENYFIPPEYLIYFSILTIRKYCQLEKINLKFNEINKELKIPTRAFIKIRQKTYFFFEILFSKNYKNYIK